MRKETLALIEQQRITGKGILTLDLACERYWTEIGQHHANPEDTKRDLNRLIDYLGKDTAMTDITDREVAALVAWRRTHRLRGEKKRPDGTPMPLVTPATVNRTCTLVLKNLFGRAKRVWRYSFPLEPVWREHILKEPKERVRELHDHEAEAIDATMRNDYLPWVTFARLTGLRRSETLIRWKDVNWSAGQIAVTGKGGALVTTPITPTIRALLEPLKDDHPEYVFTYIATKTRDGKVRGMRYPITNDGAKTQWRRMRDKAGITDLRFHDLRHDCGTKLLRATGNLKLVQRALNHSDMKSTLRYVHVLDTDVANALEALADAQKKSPKKSPTDI